jgi:6-phosphogluconolactonase
MRMKLNNSSQLLLFSAAGLLVASLVTACSQFTQTLTVDFVYVASSKAVGTDEYGSIDVFEINSESGAMRQITASPFPSGGRNPVAEAVSTDSSSLFVTNQDDNNIVQFIIGSDGKLYPYNTVNTPGIYPLALAANSSYLFVVDTYQPLSICSTAAPCSGSIAVYPLTAATGSTPITMGSPAVNTAVSGSYWPLTLSGASSSHVIVPTAVNVLTSGGGTYVYVTAYDSSVTPTVGYIFGFSVGTGGVLSALSGSPFSAGVQPSAIANYTTTVNNSAAVYVYVTDLMGKAVLGYTVSSTTGTAGRLIAMTSGTGGTNQFLAGNQPSAIVADPSYPFAYVANSSDGNVEAYSISSNGKLSFLGNSSTPVTYSAGSQPVAIGIDPSTNRFLYTANYLGSNLSGFELNITDGTLLDSQYSPYATNAQPTAVVAISHNGTGGGIQP